MNSNLKEVAIKSSIVFSGNIVSKIIGLIYGILIGRLLGASIYGQFTYVISFLSFLIMFSTLGLDNGIISFVQKFEAHNESEKKKEYVSFSLFVALIVSTLIALVIYFNLDFTLSRLLNRPNYGTIIIVLLPSIPIITIKKLLLNSLRAEKRIKELVLIRNIVSPIARLFFLIIFVVIFKLYNIYALIIGYYSYIVVEFVLIIYHIKKLNLIGKFRFSKEHFQILKYSFPMLLAGIVGIVVVNVDQFMIGYLLDSKQVGIYRVAVQFGTVSTLGLISINAIFVPIISYLYHSDKLNELKNIYAISTKWIYTINLLVFGVIILFGKEILMLVGNEFVIGYTALILISLGQTVNSLVGSAGFMNAMTGHPEYTLYGNLIVMFGNVFLNLMLIPKWGIVGAAIASMISVAVSNIFKLGFLYSHLKMHPFNKYYIGVVGAFIISLVSTYLITSTFQMHYLIKLFIGCLVYGVIYAGIIYKTTLCEEEYVLIKDFKNNKKMSKRG